MRLVWYRNDLRTIDHEALTEAMSHGPVLAVFLWAKPQWQQHDVGQPRLAFLRRSLSALRDDLQAISVPLLIAKADHFADAPRVLTRIATACSASHIHCIEEFPLNERQRDTAVRRAAQDMGVELVSHEGGAIMPPGSVVKEDGDPYSVFTPFKRRWAQHLDSSRKSPIRTPKAASETPAIPSINQIAVRTNECLNLEQTFDGVDAGLYADRWPGGQAEALKRLRRFAADCASAYQEARDLPAVPGTSTLSPYLAIGAISGRQCLARALKTNDQRILNGDAGIATWISELVWRDFYRHVLVHYPHVNKHRAFKQDTDQLPWRHDETDLQAWQQGKTGYPLVDAAMRQLNSTGWMHNRLRMVAAMFLSKHLLLDWRLGERYFMEQLVDGDFAANNGGWQWSASTGTDAAPYFRIFNPTTQAQRYDPLGVFVLSQIPELQPLAAHLPKKKKWFFEPWTAPTDHDYVAPIVDHKAARERALAAFKNA
ncbi:MAG: deoxyribodipyrimidine photo-lyase [Pseudomonadales bacterium]